MVVPASHSKDIVSVPKKTYQIGEGAASVLQAEETVYELPSYPAPNAHTTTLTRAGVHTFTLLPIVDTLKPTTPPVTCIIRF